MTPKKANGNYLQEPSNYDPTEFIIPAQDTKGHSERLWCRIQPGQSRQLQQVLRSNIFPYRTQGDVVRHALMRHLEWLEKFDETIPHHTRQTKMMISTVSEEEYNLEFLNVFDGIHRTVEGYRQNGATGEIRRFITMMLYQIRDMPMDDYWRSRYEEKMMSDYGQYLDSNGNGTGKSGKVKGVKLGSKREVAK